MLKEVIWFKHDNDFYITKDQFRVITEELIEEYKKQIGLENELWQFDIEQYEGIIRSVDKEINWRYIPEMNGQSYASKNELKQLIEKELEKVNQMEKLTIHFSQSLIDNESRAVLDLSSLLS